MEENRQEQAAVQYPVITKIEVQKKRKDRFNIYLDGSYAFPLAETVLMRTGLYKGLTLTPERRAEIEKENTEYLAYSTAVQFLSYGLRTEKEVRDRLLKDELPEEAIEKAIGRLKELRYIDDLSYGRSYTRNAAHLNAKGPALIGQELKRKGLKEMDIVQALEEYPFEQQVENGIEVAEKMLRKQHAVSSWEAQSKLKLHLMQKGYSQEAVAAVLAEVTVEKEEEEEWLALQAQGNKVWQRQSRKYEGGELRQKVKTALYQKGFPAELIQRFIETQEKKE